MSRIPQLERFLSALRTAFDRSDSSSEVMKVARKIFEALEEDKRLPRSTFPKRLPACRYLPEAGVHAQKASMALSALVSAFNEVEPEIRWAVRTAGGPNASENWLANHANGIIFGPGGVEERSDVMIGASLLAPNVRYPDHTHPPEEIYLVLTPGRFQPGTSCWFSPGVGGTLHNIPNIKHAMAWADTPLFALWCLLLKP